MRLAPVALLLFAGVSAVRGQGNPGSITGSVFDPTGAPLAVEIVLTGIDVRDRYVARASDDGQYEFKRVAPGGYRVSVGQSGLVSMTTTLAVRADAPVTLDIRTALQARMALGLSAASSTALRRWASGGTPPEQPLEWECTSGGARCVAPTLLSQPLGEIMVTALARLDGKPGVVEMSGVITTDGFLTGTSVSSATSEDLAAAALAEVSRLRWEPARLRDVPAMTSVTLDVRF